MNFLLLILEAHGDCDSRSEAQGALYAKMLAVGAELDARGQLLASESETLLANLVAPAIPDDG